MRIAAVTMVYNEATLLPIWLRHYARLVGAAQCHVVDHGSTDGSTADLQGANRLVLPRTSHDDVRRAAFMADYCASLLNWYDAVIHVDVDELVVADPAVHPGLAECVAGLAGDVATAIGFNVLHLPDCEPPLDPSLPIGVQRRYAWFSSAMCKPVLIRRRVTWAPGFHSADAPVTFAPMFLFHLRYVDRTWGFRRLAHTRRLERSDPAAGVHQTVSDATFAAMLDRLQAMDRRDDIGFEQGAAPLSDWLARVSDSAIGREAQTYRIALDIDCYELWRLPDRLAALI